MIEEEKQIEITNFKEMFASFDRGTMHLPLGVNDMQVDLNAIDIGSIIAFALS